MGLQNMSMSLQSLQYLSLLLEKHRPRRVLELGCGESTLWLARATSVEEVVSVEDDLETYNRTYRRLGWDSIVSYKKTMIHHVPADNVFYDVQKLEDAVSGTFDLILADGPSGSHRRSDELYNFITRHDHDSTIYVIDDCHRRNEKKIVDRLTKHAGPRTRFFVDEVDERPDKVHIRSTAYLIP